jgi:hypothetical protein
MELLEKNMFLACSKGSRNFFIKLLEKNMFLACLKDRMHEFQRVGLVVGLPSTLSLLPQGLRFETYENYFLEPSNWGFAP